VVSVSVGLAIIVGSRSGMGDARGGGVVEWATRGRREGFWRAPARAHVGRHCEVEVVVVGPGPRPRTEAPSITRGVKASCMTDAPNPRPKPAVCSTPRFRSRRSGVESRGARRRRGRSGLRHPVS
jgi:hypothetical protein